MIRVKEFLGSGPKPIDVHVNRFLERTNFEYVDLKLTGVNNTSTTQCDYVAILIYRAGESGEQNKHYRKALLEARHEITSSLSLDLEGLNAISIIDKALEGESE